MRWVKSAAVCIVSVGVGSNAAPARAAYVLSPVQSGTSNTSVSVEPGPVTGAFAVDFVLSSTASDSHNTAIFRPTFSAAGLTLQSYAWTNGYANATGPGQFDDSTPNAADQGDGRAVTPTTITAATFPGSAIDVEMSNAQLGVATVGNIVTLNFLVPQTWSGPSVVTLQAIPDEFALGGAPVTTTKGQDFTINIVPEPASLGVVGLLAVGLLGRRRRVH